MLLISGLPLDITESKLDELFSPYKITLLEQIDRSQSTAIAKVKFDGDDDEIRKAQKKIQEQNCEIKVVPHPEVQHSDGTVYNAYKQTERLDPESEKTSNSPTPTPTPRAKA
jgi:hypothetical protein